MANQQNSFYRRKSGLPASEQKKKNVWKTGSLTAATVNEQQKSNGSFVIFLSYIPSRWMFLVNKSRDNIAFC